MKIAFLIDSEPTNEQIQAYKWVRARTGCATKIEIEKISQTNLKEFNIIWWHYDKDLNLPEITNDGSFKSTIINFIKQGGNLLLTLSAIKLLNKLEIEPVEPDFEIIASYKPISLIPKGFASFLGHPIFRKLQNGAYTFIPSPGRKFLSIAYLNQTPKNLRVVAVEKSGNEINFKKKILFELEDKGKIIAICDNVYFSETSNPLFHNLDCLILNSLIYLNNPTKFSEPKTYWDFTEKIKEIDLKLKDKALRTAQKKIGEKETGIQFKVERSCFVQGEKIIAKISGAEIEHIAIPPFQFIRGLRLFLKKENELLTPSNIKITLKPESIARDFDFNSAKFHETIFAHPKKPTLLFNYLITSDKEVEICLQMKILPKTLTSPPVPLKNFSFGFDHKLKCVYILNENLFSLTLGSARKPKSFEFEVDDGLNVKIYFKISPGIERAFNFAITGAVKHPATPEDILSNSKELYKFSLKFPHKIFKDNLKNVKDKFRKRLLIITTDENLNNDFKLALALITKFSKNVKNFGRFFINNPENSKVNLKKLFPALSTLLKIGEYESVRNTLEFIGRHINSKGQFPSSFWLFGIFEHEDEELKWEYIKICGDYLRCSKDKLFAKFTWGRLKKLIKHDDLANKSDVINSLLLFAKFLKDETWINKLSNFKRSEPDKNNFQDVKLESIDVNSILSLSEFIQKLMSEYFYFEVDAFEKKLYFAPKIKSEPKLIGIRNLRLQNMRTHITIEETEKYLKLKFEKKDLPEINVVLEPEFERSIKFEKVLVDDKPIEKLTSTGGRLNIEFSFRFRKSVKIFFA